MPKAGVRCFLRTLDKGLPSRIDHSIFDVATGGRIEAAQRPPARSQRITCMDNAILAHHFGVSYQAASFRLKSLRHVSDRECRSLLDHDKFGREYLKALSKFNDVGEPEKRKYWDRELRSDIAYLTIEAYRHEKISRGRVLEISKMLGIAGDTLINLAEVARGC